MEGQRKGKERIADEPGKHGDDVVLWIIDMKAKLDSKSKHCQPSLPPFTICRVPQEIRRVDKHAYKPLIQIQSLHDMEEVKWRNLNEFRGRVGNEFNEYLKAMKEIEPRARDCYSGDINMKADEFIEMMLLDGLFIIELFSTRGNSFLSLILRLLNIHEEEPIYTIRGMLCRVGHDMLLLENQLPFFVLERLWNLTDQGNRFYLWNSACTFILDYALPFEHERDLNLLRVFFDEEEEEKKENPEMINEDGVHHLLHLVYSLLKPPGIHRENGLPPMSIRPRISIYGMYCETPCGHVENPSLSLPIQV